MHNARVMSGGAHGPRWEGPTGPFPQPLMDWVTLGPPLDDTPRSTATPRVA